MKKLFLQASMAVLALTGFSAMAQTSALQTLVSKTGEYCIGVKAMQQAYDNTPLEMQACSQRKEGELFAGGLQNWLFTAGNTYTRLQYIPSAMPVGEGYCVTKGTPGQPLTLQKCTKGGETGLLNPQLFLVYGGQIMAVRNGDVLSVVSAGSDATGPIVGSPVKFDKENLQSKAQNFVVKPAPI